jgi:type VI protein secretion system component VasF
VAGRSLGEDRHMSRRRTRAEDDQDRKLAFVPMWPLLAGIVLLVIVVYLLGR